MIIFIVDVVVCGEAGGNVHGGGGGDCDGDCDVNVDIGGVLVMKVVVT